MLFSSHSGGHVNFAVTIAAFVGGACEWWKIPLYFVFQNAGAIAGAALASVNFHFGL